MEILPFDIAAHLQTDADIQGFLKEAVSLAITQIFFMP